MKIWRTNDVAWRRINRETVLVHLTRHWMYALNEAGGSLWETLRDPLEGERLDSLLSDPAAAAFLADLAGEGLIDSDGPLARSRAPEFIEDDERPRIEWREEVRRFAGACGLLPGGGDLCSLQPTNS